MFGCSHSVRSDDRGWLTSPSPPYHQRTAGCPFITNSPSRLSGSHEKSCEKSLGNCALASVCVSMQSVCRPSVHGHISHLTSHKDHSNRMKNPEAGGVRRRAALRNFQTKNEPTPIDANANSGGLLVGCAAVWRAVAGCGRVWCGGAWRGVVCTLCRWCWASLGDLRLRG